MCVSVSHTGLEMIVEHLSVLCKSPTYTTYVALQLNCLQSHIQTYMYIVLGVMLILVTVLGQISVPVWAATGVLTVLKSVLARMVPAMMVRYVCPRCTRQAVYNVTAFFFFQVKVEQAPVQFVTRAILEPTVNCLFLWWWSLPSLVSLLL